MTTFILPLVYWRPELGRNDISCLKSYPEASAIVAGMENGCLWVFKADTTQNSSTFTLSPSAQLVGHKSPVVDIFFSRQDVDVGTAGEEQVIHTVAEDGEILLWNLSDGQCLQSSGTAFTAIPRSICVSPCSSYVFIGGDNTNLFVLDAQTLDVLCTMPDFNEWITQILCLCQRDNKVYFAVLTFTNLYQFIFDESSRCFSTLSTLKLDSAETAKCICTTANETMLAIISHKLTLIYRWDTNSIETYKQIKIPPTEGDWSNGKFNANRLYLWTRFSNIYVYEFQETGYVLKFRFESSFQCPSHSCILGNYLVSALHQGFEVFHVQDNEKLTSHQVFSLQDLWVSDATAHVQCQALTGQQILRGTRDGQLELSSFRKLFNTSDLSVSAHEGPVNCLTVIERTFISGGHDARICVWSSHLSLIHTFRHHATPIRQLFPIPATKMANHVLALASDHSISIFTIDTLKLVFLLPNFPNAPTKVWWKAHHVIVHYGHASCYAWDTKSGHIERVFHAASTEKLFSHCDFHIDIKGHSQRVASFQKSSLSMLTLDSCYVFMVNLKKLLTEEDTGLLECLLSALLVYEVEPALDEYMNVFGYSIVYGINTALDTLASQAFTCGDQPQASGIFLQRALVINFLTAIPISIICMFAEPLLILCGQSPHLASLSKQYIWYLLPGLIPNMVNNCVSKFLQAQGLMKGPFYASLMVFPINLTLQSVLVQKYDFKGPPIGSVLADTLTCILVIVYTWKFGKQGWHPFTRLAFKEWGVFMKLGLPGMLMICAEWWIFEIVALVAGWLGPVVLASQSVILNLAVVSYTVYYGISVACTNRIGNFLGAGQALLAKHTAYLSFFLTLCVALGSSSCIIVFRHQIGALFTTDLEVIHTVASVIPLCALFQFADGGSCVLGGIIRGCGQQKIGAVVNFVAYYVISIPSGTT
ncbi:hypothetical protein HMI54_003834 [Coelomomyces lativittatus]|nr:hypothetical protein HMI54_003834 [Coelomomyces lativittatus]